MKTKPFTTVLIAFAALMLVVTGCNAPAQKQETATEQVAAKPDMAAIKTEMQAIETEWANAATAKDIDKLMSFYADEAVEMNDDEPMLVGKAAIRQAMLKSWEARKAGTTVYYETMDVYGDGNVVTEVGKTTIKDAAGNVVSTGKYMGIFEKRNGKFFCIRDINNEDQKDK
ncbi:nuclear transport factor 2 family protein [Fibrisoma montanum]|uniref:Nuclear transport factor 2 family protein n=1 Tax=Fibrisoma montanum TaxID=2305895 RepID=A0A418M2N5_9BACT|nr:nuclear transport factor 2 family protein [Fibrisoma montanum]RIV20001.1 nuclear transport factor 2 family protein [Fibrisoma montanum]